MAVPSESRDTSTEIRSPQGLEFAERSRLRARGTALTPSSGGESSAPCGQSSAGRAWDASWSPRARRASPSARTTRIRGAARASAWASRSSPRVPTGCLDVSRNGRAADATSCVRVGEQEL